MTRALLAAAGVFLLPALALAETPAEAGTTEARPEGLPATMTLIKDEEPKTPLVPRREDLLKNHVLVGAGLGAVWSLGRFDSKTTAQRGFGTGLNLQADAGFGLSRVISVGVWGNYAKYADGSGCTDCAGRALAVGPFVRYHLAQGLRFNPWLNAGNSASTACCACSCERLNCRASNSIPRPFWDCESMSNKGSMSVPPRHWDCRL